MTVPILIIVLSMLGIAPPAMATVHGRNGRIAFRRYLDPGHTHGAIFTIRPDGTHEIQLTHPSQGTETSVPDWSPHGYWIAYAKGTPGELPSDYRLFKIHPDGNGRTYLSTTCTGQCVSDWGPAWSPNGRRIAFTRWTGVFEDRPTDHGVIAEYVMRADGTHVRRVTQPHASVDVPNRFSDLGVQWSPDGTKLVFARIDNDRDASAVFTVDLDGTGLRRLTPWWLDAGDFPDWSPNGRWILFRSHVGGDHQTNLYLVHPDGSGLRRITDTFGGHVSWFSYSFSPSGRRITLGRAVGAGEADICTMRLDGSGLRNITDSPQWETAPDWGSRRS